MTSGSRSISRKPLSGRRIAESPPPYVARVLYVESSALIAALLEGDEQAATALRSEATLVTSALTFAECKRALVRAAHAGRLSTARAALLSQALNTFAARCATVSVTSEILERAAEAFPVEPVRTLDGIHLATLAAVSEPTESVRVLTRDVRVTANVLAMGFAIA